MKKEFNVEVGAQIRKKREALGFTREQLAEKAELSAQFLAEIELGHKGASALTLRKLCDAMQVSADLLLRGKEPSGAFPQFTELLSHLDEAYLPLAEELLRTYMKTVALKKTQSLQE